MLFNRVMNALVVKKTFDPTLKFKKIHPEAVIPSRAFDSDAGLDVTAIAYSYDIENDLHVYNTGLAVSIPKGFVGLIFPRSSICKTGMSLSNAVGVIDSSYRGEIMFKFRHIGGNARKYEAGEKVGQLVVVPCALSSAEEVDDLDETIRGSGGFGSSGK